ncbi:MAG TPA: hypothetical protein VKZ53_30175 [Candidatus Angelobacter sp.]|nr:hypothetical protein [Candidatus Angelobacter sp.]
MYMPHELHVDELRMEDLCIEDLRMEELRVEPSGKKAAMEIEAICNLACRCSGRLGRKPLNLHAGVDGISDALWNVEKSRQANCFYRKGYPFKCLQCLFALIVA